jgi:hypothetical protein
MPFVGTLEEDTIIHTIFDLEQFIGKEITWVSGMTFDEVLKSKGGILPNAMRRYCTTWLKMMPMFHWWYSNCHPDPAEFRIGYRANETSRAKRAIEKADENGIQEIKASIEKHSSGKNKWEIFKWQKQIYPLIEDNIYKDDIVSFWRGKGVRFALHNNCVGCFHRNEILLKKMSEAHPNKFDWFMNREKELVGKNKWAGWKATDKDYMTYEEIKNHHLQVEIDFEDFSDCDSGYCGV